jgi:excisionase family DNA binding protein
VPYRRKDLGVPGESPATTGESPAPPRKQKENFMTNTTTQSAGTPGLEPRLTKKDVAKLLGKKIRTVDNWMKEGRLPYCKVGRSVLFKWSDVEKHLDSNFRVCRFGNN